MAALGDIAARPAPAAAGEPRAAATVTAAGGAKSVFVAVAGGGDAAAQAAPHAAAPARAGAPPALERRVVEQAVWLGTNALPAVWAAVAVAVGAVLAGVDASAWRDGAAAAALACATAWAALPWLAMQRRLPRPAGWRTHDLIAVLGAATLLCLAMLPWLPGASPAPVERGLVLALVGVAAAAAAVVLAPRPLLAWLVVAPALSGSVAEALRPEPADALPAGLALALAAALVMLACRRAWTRAARAALAREDRITRSEAERDDALRADQEKSRFLAIASHDLRQPVHALGLFAATLETRLKGMPEEPLVRNVVRAIDGLDRSFNAMLDVSRLDAGTVEPNLQHFPLRDLFRRLHMHFAGQAEQAGLNLRFSPGGKSVTSDPQLLERILGNLVQNAIRYTEQGGIAVLARTTATHYHIEVWDTGVGIRAADLPRIFDEFYQVGRDRRTRGQGLGMGLAIVKRLARLLGHTLTVASQPGRGTMFRIGVPIGGLPGIQDATAAADTVPMPVLQPRTVLIVDDEASIREGLGLLLEEWGYQAVAAADLEQAGRMLGMLDTPPDLILSDLHLGDGPDGIAVIESVRRRCGVPVPAILVTGDTTHEEMRRARESGHPVLFKPVQPRKLLNAMRGLVS